MLLLVLLAILALIAFGVGFTIHWLFIVAVVLALVWLISMFLGGGGGRSPGAWGWGSDAATRREKGDQAGGAGRGRQGVRARAGRLRAPRRGDRREDRQQGTGAHGRGSDALVPLPQRHLLGPARGPALGHGRAARPDLRAALPGSAVSRHRGTLQDAEARPRTRRRGAEAPLGPGRSSHRLAAARVTGGDPAAKHG